MRIERSIDIAAPPATVFAILTDVERWSEWTESVTSAHILDGGALQVGSRVELSQPRIGKVTWEVTRLEQDRGFDWQSTSSGVKSIARHWIEPLESGARVTLTIDQEGFIVRLLGFYIRRVGERYTDMEAQGLKARAEAASPASDP